MSSSRGPCHTRSGPIHPHPHRQAYLGRRSRSSRGVPCTHDGPFLLRTRPRGRTHHASDVRTSGPVDHPPHASTVDQPDGPMDLYTRPRPSTWARSRSSSIRADHIAYKPGRLEPCAGDSIFRSGIPTADGLCFIQHRAFALHVASIPKLGSTRHGSPMWSPHTRGPIHITKSILPPVLPAPCTSIADEPNTRTRGRTSRRRAPSSCEEAPNSPVRATLHRLQRCT